MLDGEQPGREGVLPEQLISGIGLAILRQDGQQVADPNKAGGEMPAFGLNIVGQILCYRPRVRATTCSTTSAIAAGCFAKRSALWARVGSTSDDGE